ncbi:MAG: SDR family NAD(P)-dependent oxidoreductase [Bacteroidales bacterium]|nr:SDR family NAD(P)-dependent oxidoreductase [Bacteroidales bacterium]
MEMNGRIIVTGATGGMGAAAVEALAAQGKPVLMACRNLGKAEAVRTDILRRIPEADLQVGKLDLSSLSSVRSFAAGIEPGSVSGIFHNAGVISKKHILTEDGFENTFSVNYFGPWILTLLLLPKLPAGARIVSMVSLTCRFAPLKESMLQPSERDFSQLRTYARAKRALLSFSLELARRHPDLRVHLADPGIVGSDMIDLGHWFDPLADILFKPFCKTPSKGVQPALRALSTTEDSTRYYVGKAARAVPRRYLDPLLDKRIWEKTVLLVNPWL